MNFLSISNARIHAFTIQACMKFLSFPFIYSWALKFSLGKEPSEDITFDCLFFSLENFRPSISGIYKCKRSWRNFENCEKIKIWSGKKNNKNVIKNVICTRYTARIISLCDTVNNWTKAIALNTKNPGMGQHPCLMLPTSSNTISLRRYFPSWAVT